jgi:hypothetical protein
MAEKMINSLIYGDHPIPKKQRPLKQRIMIPTAIAIAVILLLVGAYKFFNYREEGSVSTFIADLRQGNYEKAYANWDLTDSHYSMKDFIDDWGKDGFYGKTMATAKVTDSHVQGEAVIVYVTREGSKSPIAFLVDKGTLKLSFYVNNKYTIKGERSIS